MKLKLDGAFFKGKRILNVGCGNDTFGTDFVDLYPSRPEVIKCDMNNDEPLPYKDEKFDVVYSRSNFEHLSCPKHFVKEAYRVLKKGRYLIIITDNANYFGYSFTSLHHGGYGGYGNEDVHYGLYTQEHLIAHVKNFNFLTVDSGYCKLDILKRWHKYGGKRVSSLMIKDSDLLFLLPHKLFKRFFGRASYIIAQKGE